MLCGSSDNSNYGAGSMRQVLVLFVNNDVCILLANPEWAHPIPPPPTGADMGCHQSSLGVVLAAAWVVADLSGGHEYRIDRPHSCQTCGQCGVSMEVHRAHRAASGGPATWVVLTPCDYHHRHHHAT